MARQVYTIRAIVTGSIFEPQKALFRVNERIKRTGWDSSFIVNAEDTRRSAIIGRDIRTAFRVKVPAGQTASIRHAASIVRRAAVAENYGFKWLGESKSELGTFIRQRTEETLEQDFCEEILKVKCKTLVIGVSLVAAAMIVGNVAGVFRSITGR